MELTADALNAFSHVLPTGFFVKISENLNLSVEKTKYTMMSIIPAIFTELQKKTHSPENLQKMANAIHDSGFDNPASVTSDVSNVASQINKGQDLLRRLLPENQTDSLLGKISVAAGVNTSQGSKLLGAASAAAFTFIGTKMKDGKITPSAFSQILGPNFGSIPDMPKHMPTHEARSSTVRKYWPWVLLAVAIAIIWWSQGRTSKPLLSQRQVNSSALSLTASTKASASSDQSVVSELAQFLANPSAVAPTAFSLRELNFPNGASQLSAEAVTTTNAIASLLNQYPTVRLRLVGHTDNIGIESVNQKLSMDRAEALKQALINQGIAADRIETAGMGSVQPVADNANENGRSQNRRVDLQVIRR